MNLREANLEAQRRWGPCGCAWREMPKSGNDFGMNCRVGILIPTPTTEMTLGVGRDWDEAFASIETSNRLTQPNGVAWPGTDEQIRDMAVQSPDVDPKYRIAVERVKAAMTDARQMVGDGNAYEALVAVTGFILTERART